MAFERSDRPPADRGRPSLRLIFCCCFSCCFSLFVFLFFFCPRCLEVLRLLLGPLRLEVGALRRRGLVRGVGLHGVVAVRRDRAHAHQAGRRASARLRAHKHSSTGRHEKTKRSKVRIDVLVSVRIDGHCSDRSSALLAGYCPFLCD